MSDTMCFKTLGVILQEVLNMPVKLEQSYELGKVIKKHVPVDGSFVYVKTPSHTGEVHTSRAYNQIAESRIKEFLEKNIIVKILNDMSKGEKHDFIEALIEEQDEIPF